MHRWRQSFPARQLRVRPLACLALAFLLGLLSAYRWHMPWPVCLAGGLVAAGWTASSALRHRRAAAALLLAGALLGMARMSLALEAIPAVETRFDVDMVGRVNSEPFIHPRTGRCIARFQLESADGTAEALCLRLYLRGDEEALRNIQYGQRLSLNGHIWQSDPVTNPCEFDFGAWLNRNGFAAIATAKIEDVTLLDTRRDLHSLLIASRAAIAHRIDVLFPKSAGLVRALTLGDRSQLGEELRSSLNATGTAHLIAISGMHVTVLAFALVLLLERALPRRLARLAAIAPLILYGALIGFTPSFLRALVMFAVLSFAPVAGLPSDPCTRLATALLLCTVIRPLDVMDAGLALSFSASAGIMLLTAPIQSLFGLTPRARRDRDAWRRTRLLRQLAVYFADLLCASLAAQLMTLPAVIAWFGVQSVVSLPFNLLCVPLCMTGYVLAMGALLLSALWLPLGAVLARIPDALLSALLALTRLSESLPVTTVRIGRYPAVLILLHCGIAVAASGLSRLRLDVRRWLPTLLIAVAALSSLFTWAQAWPFSVVFLDAGQADSAIVRTRGRTYLFDAGDSYTPAADYLSATCLHLDAVFLSHPHQDHVGGLEDILDVFKPDVIYVPMGWYDNGDVSASVQEVIDRARRLGVPVCELAAGDGVWLSDEAEMTVWSPELDGPPMAGNDLSILALVARGKDTVLFAGDLSYAGEPETVPDCDVLKVAHHGSDKASSQRFLNAATPEIAVISVGENDFGHPNPNTLSRLSESGARILRTDRLGAITLRPVDGVWRVKTFLEAPDELE